MSKLLKITLVLAFAVGLFGAYRFGAAQEAGSASDRIAIHWPSFDVEISPNVTLATKHVLEGTYISSGQYDNNVPANTNVALDAPLTVPCPGTTGTCTIQGDIWVENGGSPITMDINDVCLYVDGKPTIACNYDTGESAPDATPGTTSTSQLVTGVEHGNHKVQTYFWSYKGTYVGYYSINYRVYKP
jgi:hypothetical protein